MINWIRNIFRRKKKLSYSFHSFTIPAYDKVDLNTPGFAIMMPTKAHKPIRKWYQIFKKKPKYPNVKWTDNPDGSKTWEIII